MGLMPDQQLLYLIKKLHQITATTEKYEQIQELYLIKKLHQITAKQIVSKDGVSYILLRNYIKSQQ